MASHPKARPWARRTLLAIWIVVLVPGGLGDLVLNPHRVATAVALLALGVIVLATFWQWPRALAPVSVGLAALLIADDLLDGRGVWGTISLALDVALAAAAIADLRLGGGSASRRAVHRNRIG